MNKNLELTTRVASSIKFLKLQNKIVDSKGLFYYNLSHHISCFHEVDAA